MNCRPGVSQAALRGNPFGAGTREARFRLRYISPRHFADPEAITRRFELALQDAFIAHIELDFRLIPDNIRIGSYNVQQNRLFGIGKPRPGRL